MKLLALDTSTEQLSLAVSVNGETFVDEAVVGNASSTHVLPKIQALLTAANVTMADLDGIAYGAGPGSFTGVRIATGVTQGLALAHNLPVVGVCTLLSLAQASDTDKVIVCTDARMGEVYHAVYQQSVEGWKAEVSPGVYPPEKVPPVEGEHWIGVGSGWNVYGDILKEVYGQQIAQVFGEAMPSANAILSLALPSFEKGEGQPASEAIPLYVRNRVALTAAQRAAGERL